MLFVLLLLLTALPDSPAQLLQSGLVALERGDLAEARSALEQVAKAEPENSYAWASLAETYARLKQPDAASAAADKAEKTGGDNPLICHALAIYYTGTGEFAHAAQLEEKYAASDKADSGALERAAALYLNGGDPQSAMRLAQKAPPSPKLEDLIGRALISSGDAKDGVGHLAAAWHAAQGDLLISFDYAQALLQQQEFGPAAEVAITALRAHPDDAQLTLALGVARYGQRRFEDAVATFLKVIRIDPRIEQPYLFLGKMLDQAGEHMGEITSAYEKWVDQNPKSATALLLLAKARLTSDSRDATAETLLRTSISLDERNWEAHYELGALLAGKRDWPAAAAELKRSVDLDAKQAMPHYHLARVYDRLGDTEKAKAERALHETLLAPNR